MRWLNLLAAAAFLFLFPIPMYWLVLHPLAGMWRRVGLQTAFLTGIAVAAIPTLSALFFLYDRLFAAELAPLWARILGLALMAGELVMIRTVVRALGPERLVGRSEMAGAGELMTTGIYARIRHPSYAGMMAAFLGVGLLAGTLLLWAFIAVWFVLMRLMVAFEERELAARFGEPYLRYRARVPAFLPFRFWPRED